MGFKKKYISRIRFNYVKSVTLAMWLVISCMYGYSQGFVNDDDTTPAATEPIYPIEEKGTYPFSTSSYTSPLLMPLPSNVEQTIVYDPETHSYVFSEKVGQINYRTPTQMSFEEYLVYDLESGTSDYWYEKARTDGGAGPSFMKNLLSGTQSIDKVLGSDAITINPSGSAGLTFGYQWTKNDNPQLSEDNRTNGSFIFKENIEVNVNGNIGDKFEIGFSYNTEATFDFENKTKLEYNGKEDEIIKKIQAGDVTFEVPGTLISGCQSLFGIRTDLQFGKLSVSAVISHQRSESSTINVQGGAQEMDFEVEVADYDVNRHFFLSHFFHDNYNEWMESLPTITSKVEIGAIEVWVVNSSDDYEEARDIVAFTDLGEGWEYFDYEGSDDNIANFGDNLLESGLEIKQVSNKPARNGLNGIMAAFKGKTEFDDISSVNSLIETKNLVEGRDYVKLESARKLESSEYEVNEDLGYISLQSPLRNDQILAVAYQYSYGASKTYQVGELASLESDKEKVLIVKLLKGTTQSPRIANWDLMMKNVYSIGAYQVSSEDFELNILYKDSKTGQPVNYIAVDTNKYAMSSKVNKKNLLKVLELDNLDSQNEANPDGVFDFVSGVTIDATRGRIYFPLIEPFGKDLRERMIDVDGATDAELKELNETADDYVFEELYDSTQTQAEQIASKNKFLLSGTYQSSSSSEIYLDAMNIPEGSVTVTVGGTPLVEGTDYTVDYTLGRVQILNTGLLESGMPIKISLESNSLFNLQTKTFYGLTANYQFNKNFNVGGTIMHLSETPLTEKVSMGDEPISNTMFGAIASYRTESQYLTTLIDKLPLIETKKPSSISLDAEVAYLMPGQSKYIREGNESVAYIDDFEGTQTKIDLKYVHYWRHSSIPQHQEDEYPNSEDNGLNAGFGRAKLSWYSIDQVFYGNSPPSGVPDRALTSHYSRQIKMKELFPEKDEEYSGYESQISVLNLVYYPRERGIYNYSTDLQDGFFTDPEVKWGGMMRELSTTDFETSNIEYIEFWMMDPYVEKSNPQIGDDAALYFHLGEISEDILPDSRKSFENGLPTSDDKSDVDWTGWAYVPVGQSITNSFGSGDEERSYQDIGLDGLNDDEEADLFSDFMSGISDQPDDVKADIEADPSRDNYEYYITSDHASQNHDILRRYKFYNGLEGNSPSSTSDTYGSRSTPDKEDINDDNTLNTTEAYFEYRISLEPENFVVGKNYIVDKKTISADNNNTDVNWYLFRVPVDEYDNSYGDISDFKSVRFMRMVLKGFTDTVVCRFASLDMVRSDWRRYKYDLNTAGPSLTLQTQELADFTVSAVNIEENSEKEPVNYILPPGVTRETDPTNTSYQELNEQSLLLNITNLEETDARAVYKSADLDLRQYKKLELYVHAEALIGEQLADNELTAFIRLGSDYTYNYYEYEMPLKITPDRATQYDGDNDIDRDSVWKNLIKVALDDFVSVKKERNNKVSENSDLYSTLKVYSKADENYPMRRIKVMGNPTLSDVAVIMLGVRNPGDELSTTTTVNNDGKAKSVEVWFNELRLKEFNNKGGGAANGRAQFQLADLGVLNVSGSYSEPGFGGIEEKVDERQTEEINQYNINTSIELGKLFPEKAQVSIPMYFGLSTTIINPEYYPGDPDILYEDYLAEHPELADEIKAESQDYTSRKSINFTNVKWNKNFKKIGLVSPRNFSGSLDYSEVNQHDYNLEYDNYREYGFNIAYRYSAKPKSIKPFAKSKNKLIRKPSMRLIRDLNFNLVPTQFSFVNTIDRSYQETKLRDVDGYGLKIDSTISKDFTWNRNYSLKYDPMQNLKFTYSATNTAQIDEPDGAFDLFEDADGYYTESGWQSIDWKDTVWNSIINYGGRNMRFNQKFNVSYNVPLNKIPLLNWVTLNGSYAANYYWVRGSDPVDIYPLGHTLSNSNNLKLSSRLNMRNLYNKIGYLKRLDRKYQGGKKKKDIEYKEVTFEKRTFVKADVPKKITHNLKTKKIEVKVIDADSKPVEIDFSVMDENRVTIQSKKDLSGITVIVTGQVPKKENPVIFIAENSLRFLLGIKSIDVSYTRSAGTEIPGYTPETTVLGFSSASLDAAPGWPFILGYNDESFIQEAAESNWLTKDTNSIREINMNYTENLSVRTSFEPFSGFRIDLNTKREYGEQIEQNYAWDEAGAAANPNSSNYMGDYYFGSVYTGGSYSISSITLLTAFDGVNFWEAYDKDDAIYTSAAFEKFRDNTEYIVDELQERYTSNPSTDTTYSISSTEALIPAFYSAYSGIDPDKMSLENIFHYIMLPNWRFTFNGLTKIDFFKRYFKTISLKHAYTSTYSIGSFSTNSEFAELGEDLDFPELLDGYSKYIVGTVSFSEDFGPLIGFDMEWVNSLQTSFDIEQSRMVSLSTSNNKVTETRSRDFVIGAGYRFKEVPISITTSSGKRQFKSDVNLKLDLTIRDNITILRSLTVSEDDELSEITTGVRKFVLGLTADYKFTENFNMQFYSDWTTNQPYTSAQYNNSEFNIGLSMQLSL